MVISKVIVPSEQQNEKAEEIKGHKRVLVKAPLKPKKSSAAEAKVVNTRRKTSVIEPEIISDEASDEDGSLFSNSRESDIIDIGETPEDDSFDFDEDRSEIHLPAIPDALEPELVDEDEDENAEELAEEKGLVLSSGLQRYLAEIRKYPLLTREQEREIAFLMYEKGDLDARNKLINSNLRLVVKIAMGYRRAYLQILDLIQEGNAGLVQAVNRFNPYKGVKLSTYSAWWIRAYILKFLMDNKSLVRMGTTDAQRKLFFRLRSEAEKMYALTQRFDVHLLAESIGVKDSDVVEMQQRLTKNDMSLDTPLGEDSDARQIDNLISNFERPDLVFEREELLKILREGIKEIEKELSDRDMYIFKNRILADDPITLQEVGENFGITRERARQLESRVLKRIKEKLIIKGIIP